MPIARFEMPDGRVGRFEVPEGTTPEQAQAMIAESMQNAKAPVEPAATKKQWPPASLESPDKYQNIGNAAAGLIRGAGSIGSTLLAPYDMAKDALAGKGLTLESNLQRRAEIEAGLQGMGAQPESTQYQGGKLAGEIAGTAGVGGVLANGVRTIAPGMPALANALATSGMKAGSVPGAANMLTRMAGGAITGGATAGLIDPSMAGTGAAIGGAMPPAMAATRLIGKGVGNVFSGQAMPLDTKLAVESARKAGYVIPPTQAKPSFLNRAIEGFSGKLTTAQNASARNAPVTDALAAKALGLSPDTKITPELLNDVRNTAGKAYEAIGNAGIISPGKAYLDALDDLAKPYLKAAQGFPNAKPSPVLELVESMKSPSFDASSAIAKIKELRSAADDAFRTGNTDIARASKGAAKALEDAIDQHLQKIGNNDLLDTFRKSRELIAKTYSVEKALNPATGTVDAIKLAAQLDKKKPLSGELRTAAEFAKRFPKAAQVPEKMGSLPQTSPLDYAALGTISAATSNPLPMAALLARPGARKLALSDLVQNRLASGSGQNSLARLMMNPDAEQLLYRSAPVIGAR